MIVVKVTASDRMPSSASVWFSRSAVLILIKFNYLHISSEAQFAEHLELILCFKP